MKEIDIVALDKAWYADIQQKTVMIQDLIDKHLTGWRFCSDVNLPGPIIACCCYEIKTIYIPKLSLAWKNSECLTQITLHEIAHALTEGHTHDDIWQNKAIELGAQTTGFWGGAIKPEKEPFMQCEELGINLSKTPKKTI